MEFLKHCIYHDKLVSWWDEACDLCEVGDWWSKPELPEYKLRISKKFINKSFWVTN